MIGVLWEGRVDSVEETSFVATLYDILDTSREYREEARISFEEAGFKKEDTIPGKVFYWVITVAGKKGHSHFGWKDMGTYTKEELKRAGIEAKDLLSKIKFE